MSTEASAPQTGAAELKLDANKVGMVCLIVTESVLFMTLVLVYLFYLDKSLPVAKEHLSLSLAILGSIFLFSSSGTVDLAESSLSQGNDSRFRVMWGVTITLGVAFLVCTGIEWSELLAAGYGMSSGFFGSTYFTLVGFHAAHVTIGVVLMSTYFGTYCRGPIPEKSHKAAVLISWYWHFVDAVWVVVLVVVYGLTLV